MFTIVFYKDLENNSPVDDFLDELKSKNIKLYVKTERMLQLLEEKGNMLTEPYSKHIKKGLYELRTIQGNNLTRMFYFFAKEKIIVVDHGIIKKSNRVSSRDIQVALKRKDDFERRTNE